MPYDESEQKWKFNVFNEEGNLAGLIEPEPSKKCWPGRPQDGHFEVMYQIEDETNWHLLLYRFDRKEYSKDDYGRILTPARAADWLKEEGYPLPENLLPPLPTSLQEVWGLLDRKCLLAKEIATKLLKNPRKDKTIARRITDIRKTGRQIKNLSGHGYYRPDSPPPSKLSSTRAHP